MAEVDARTEKPSAPPVGVLVLVGILIAGFVLLPRIFTPRESAMVGKDAPDFTLDVIANDAAHPAVHLAELRGKAVVLDFWASWCGPCQQEAPIISKFAQRMRDRGVVVVGVNTDDKMSDAQAFATQNLAFPVVFDGTGATARSFGVTSLPTLVVVSRQGKVVALRTGMTEDSELERIVSQAW